MLCYLLAALLVGAPPNPTDAAPADTVVVCPETFRAALSPWLEHRRAQGHAIAVVDNQGSAAEVRSRIFAAGSAPSLRHVLLVGDAPSVNGNPPNCVATFYPAARVNVLFGSEPTIASDHLYGDLDTDGVPEIAVGRLPAASAAELSTMVAKVLAYEHSVDLGTWRRQINFIAGIGGFGGLTDLALEAATKTILCHSIPAAYATSMTYASWQSPYCPAPARFRQTVLDRLNEGSLCWVYMGHGQPQALDTVQAPDGSHPILSSRDAPRLRSAHNAPIALFLACYAGAFDATGGCLGEDFLRSSGGPVAVVCGSRVTMPYAMAVLGTEMLDQWLHARRATLGDVLLHAKRAALLGARDDLRSRVLDSVAATINPLGTDLAEERAEHVLLFNLLGDPLLRIRHAELADVTTAAEASPGDTLTIAVHSPIHTGEAVVELVVRRDRTTFDAQQRTTYDDSPDEQEIYQRQYVRANDHRLATTTVPVTAEAFQVTIPVPRHAHGPCHVRVFIRGTDGFGLGAADVNITR
ncbi:MAG TPA: C25 family cysteine peptidase [Pirellulales bacterium]|jgi:hypothetical protein|nr:C25 family cysteine peptidase [Pirellulales bacterium]